MFWNVKFWLNQNFQLGTKWFIVWQCYVEKVETVGGSKNIKMQV